jgi:hypothetical protein
MTRSIALLPVVVLAVALTTAGCVEDVRSGLETVSHQQTDGPPPGDQLSDQRGAGPTTGTGTTVDSGPPLSAARDDGQPVEITFDDVNLRIQADVVFRPWMLTDRVKELDGRRVRIRGYMLPHERATGIRQFVLLRNKECKFGPGGQADHLVNVTLQDGVTTSYRHQVVQVQGVLKVNPFQGPDGNTWSIYDLAGERVAIDKRR